MISLKDYLKEARELVVNKDKPFPDYYDESSNVYETMVRTRKAYLV